MNEVYDLEKSFPPKRIEEVEYFLTHYLDGIKISKDDKRLKYLLNDPYVPEMKLIKGVYISYKKTVLELLEGRIDSISSYEFTNPKRKHRTISDEDIEYVLEMATVIMLASENDQILTTYFAATSADKVNSMMNLCLGYSKELKEKKFKTSLQNFLNDIEVVRQMGLLEAIMGK